MSKKKCHKRQYKTQLQANNVVARIQQEASGHHKTCCRVYYCCDCFSFHITSKPIYFGGV